MEQVEQPLDDLLAGVVALDRAELRGADGDGAILRFTGVGPPLGQREQHLQQHVGAGLEVGGSVCSAGLWLMPFSLGTKTIPVGHTRASIWASWPAPDGRRITGVAQLVGAVARRGRRPRSSKSTGSNRARERRSTVTPSAAATSSHDAASRRSASQHRLVGVAQVDGQRGRPGDDVDEVGAQVEPGRRCRPGAAELVGEPAHEGHDLGGDEAGVVAHRHRRRAGVVRLAGDRQLLPRDALDAGDGADRDALGLEDRALLDVQLDEGVRRRTGARRRAEVADARQLVAEAGAVDPVTSRASSSGRPPT